MSDDVTNTVRVVLRGANVVMVDGENRHRAGQLEIQKDGEVLFDVQDSDWVFSVSDLREIADAADRFKTFAALWTPCACAKVAALKVVDLIERRDEVRAA